MSSNDIELLSVSKQFGANCIVDDINLAVPKGKFVSILGPSGCGKTTTLNMIAGFENPSSGEIRIRGRNQAGVRPEARKIGLVFQNYALFPHMTVAENVGFGLKMQGKPREDISEEVARALKSVHLEGFEKRYPKELSGGQQQRVAVARAIAPSPSVLLLDEPLSNLDLKLREAMRVELKEIQQELGMTFVYVTHDQEEAMAMSDRIIVMQGGVVAQEGSPADIYNQPRTSFVADFIGKSNILPVSGLDDTAIDDGCVHVLLGEANLPIIAAWPQDLVPGKARFCCIRPEAVRLADAAGAMDGPVNLLTASVQKVVNLGAYLEAWLSVNDETTLKSMIRSTRLDMLSVGSRVELAIAHSAVQLLEQ
ncbi:ABC transporter ATP-binding protein [Rhizobium mongolense]|uniref:ABC-type Fe3+/spermidine/putrescine transport system ATPase subunit n=1 Tax=Rhizobium mongolense TaxID=57676 RepID=A0A7W6RTJ0_9HYPH|nr:ABC transporter ATP-binding protein [Rhizobium mongolense]MBB4277816.1 ABC-type Fe3+/spermidine/putrescine transport system ATPase subunit [Rhizobium mongolense]